MIKEICTLPKCEKYKWPTRHIVWKYGFLLSRLTKPSGASEACGSFSFGEQQASKIDRSGKIIFFWKFCFVYFVERLMQLNHYPKERLRILTLLWWLPLVFKCGFTLEVCCVPWHDRAKLAVHNRGKCGCFVLINEWLFRSICLILNPNQSAFRSTSPRAIQANFILRSIRVRWFSESI